MNKFLDILRLVFLIFLFLVNIIFYLILPQKISNKIYYFILKNYISSKLFNTKINVIGEKDLLNKKGCILIANHQNTQDLPIIASKFNDTYGVAKSNICSDNTLPCYLRFTKYLEIYIIKSLRFIPYMRGNRDSGELVKKEIINLVNKKKNILVFPEGKCRKTGIVEEFKSGLFRTASENNIPIIPITLKYKRPIGQDSRENSNPLDWFNNEVDMYIHPIQQDVDWAKLKQICFNLVKQPMIN